MLSKFIKKFAQYQLILPIKASFERSLMGRKGVLKMLEHLFFDFAIERKVQSLKQ